MCQHKRGASNYNFNSKRKPHGRRDLTRRALSCRYHRAFVNKLYVTHMFHAPRDTAERLCGNNYVLEVCSSKHGCPGANTNIITECCAQIIGLSEVVILSTRSVGRSISRRWKPLVDEDIIARCSCISRDLGELICLTFVYPLMRLAQGHNHWLFDPAVPMAISYGVVSPSRERNDRPTNQRLCVQESLRVL